MRITHTRYLPDETAFREALQKALGDKLLAVENFGADRSLEIYLTDEANATDEALVQGIRARFDALTLTPPISLEAQVATMRTRLVAVEEAVKLIQEQLLNLGTRTVVGDIKAEAKKRNED